MKKGKEPNSSIGILVILMVGAFVALLSNTLLNIALPSIMADFDVSPSTVQWLTTGYMLVNGVLIPTTAFFIQKYSARTLFLVAMGLFTIGTVIGGIAPSFAILLSARMIQASGAALIMPLLMNVMFTTFPPEKRGSAMGFFGLVMVFAPAIGPTLSGWVIQNYEWPVLFLMMIPILVVVWVLGFLKLHDGKTRGAQSIDTLSVIFSALGFGGILYGFSTAGDSGWGSINVYGTLLIGVLALVALIVRQFSLQAPMLDFRVYKYPMFALASGISITLNMAMFSAMLLMPIYLQNIRGISALDSGLLLLPGALVMGVMSPITGKLFDKFGPKVLALTGLTVVIVTTYFFSQLTATTSYTSLIWLYSLRMFGISMVMMPIMTNGLNSLPPKYTPHGTAMNGTIQQVSGAVGASLLVSVMTTRTAGYQQELVAATPPTSEEMAVQLYNQAAISGINDAFFVATWIAVLALVGAFFLKRTIYQAEAKEVREASTREKVLPARS